MTPFHALPAWVRRVSTRLSRTEIIRQTDFFERKSPEIGRWWERGSRTSARARPNRTRAPRGCESHGSRTGWPRPPAHRPAPVLRTGRACSQPHRGVSRWGSWLVLACSTAQRCTPRLAAYLYAHGQWYVAWSRLARSSRRAGPLGLGLVGPNPVLVHVFGAAVCSTEHSRWPPVASQRR